ACAARRSACAAPARCSGTSGAETTSECTHPPCLWPHRSRRQRDCFVPSSTPFLARFGLKAHATVRGEEDTGAVPRSPTGSMAFAHARAPIQRRAVGQNRPLAHSGKFCRHKSTEQPLTPLAQGMSDCFDVPVVICLRAFFTCTQGCGC